MSDRKTKPHTLEDATLDTVSGGPLDALRVINRINSPSHAPNNGGTPTEAVWDDTDIVHVKR